MIDIGLNLASGQFKNDRFQIIQNAQKAGVNGFILTGTSLKDSHLVLKESCKNPTIMRSTYGVHPHVASELIDDKIILEQGKHKNVIAIGECGLDYDRMRSTKDEQIKALEIQLNVAHKLNKPVFLHIRPKIGDEKTVMNDFSQIYKKYNCRGVVHCFTGNKTMLDILLDMGLYIGLTGWVADKRRSQELSKIVKYIPEDKIMIETDAPYLTPQNMPKELFKRRNEPKFLKYVLEAVSGCYKMSSEEMEEITDENVENLFKWRPEHE